jgi:hypothetical protein
MCARLLDLGCVYLCAWGHDCERVHNVMDEMVVGSSPPETYRAPVTTTWHARESLEETVDFFLQSANPNEDFEPVGDCHAVILTIGADAATADRHP